MHRVVVLLPLVLVGCIDNYVGPTDKMDPEVLDGSLSGRVCDPSGRTWLPDALVYVNLLDEDMRVQETRIAYTDLDGFWKIDDLPGDTWYHWYVQYGPDPLLDGTDYVPSGKDVVIEEPGCFDPLALDVAVVTGAYDDFDDVLDAIGFANYFVVNGLDRAEVGDFLSNAERMSQYDIIFFNGGFLEDGIIYGDPAAAARVDNLRTFVAEGGSVYASDWAYDLIELAWPGELDFAGDDGVPDDAQMGDPDSCTAKVSDAELAELLGTDEISITFELPVWSPILTGEDNVTAHLMGSDLAYSDGRNDTILATAPLLVSFNAGQGRVVYSTFRVAANAGPEMLDTLQYMMYSL